MKLELSVALVMATFPTIVAATVAQPVNSELKADSDTWVDQAAPESTFGKDRGLVARLGPGGASRILLGFDLTPLRAASVESAKLLLQLTEASGAPSVQMAVSRLSGRFTEKTTWTNQPDRGETRSIVDVGDQPGEFTWDATQLLAASIDSNARFVGIALSGPVASVPNYSRTFASREAETHPPKLIVRYIRVGGVAETGASPEPSPPGAKAARIGLASIAAAILSVLGAIRFKRRRRTLRYAFPVTG